jgi:HEAT repeat protein
MPDFPIRDVFAPLGWIFLGLLAINALLFLVLVLMREKWVFYRRRRQRVRAQLAPSVERLVSDDDPNGIVEELRPRVANLGRKDRPVAAWLLRDLTRDADEATRARIRRVIEETGATELAERSTGRWTPWRRALACEILGAIGAERSVPVLEARLRDKRSEVRMAAARALGAIGSPAAAAALTRIFLERRAVPIGVAYDALRGLGPAGADAFHQGLRAQDPSVRVASCFGVAALAAERGDPTAAEGLARLLEGDSNVRVRTAAAKALGVLGGTTAPRVLVDAVHDPEVRVRREAVAALGHFDEPATVETLAALAGDRDREVALRSAESLLALRERPRAGGRAQAAVARSSSWSVEYAVTVSELATV